MINSLFRSSLFLFFMRAFYYCFTSLYIWLVRYHVRIFFITIFYSSYSIQDYHFYKIPYRIFACSFIVFPIFISCSLFYYSAIFFTIKFISQCLFFRGVHFLSHFFIKVSMFSSFIILISSSTFIEIYVLPFVSIIIFGDTLFSSCQFVLSNFVVLIIFLNYCCFWVFIFFYLFFHQNHQVLLLYKPNSVFASTAAHYPNIIYVNMYGVCSQTNHSFV